MQTSAFLADLATLARLSVPTLSEQQAETRAAAAFLLLVGHPTPSEALRSRTQLPDISLAHYLEALQASSSQR
jgi:hypothetical protein